MLILDLDGTILSVNSFPYWALYMLTGHFGGLNPWQRLALSAGTGRVLLSRKLFGQPHYRCKYRLQELWSRSLERDATQAAAQNLYGILKNYIRPNMKGVLHGVAEKRVDAVLATSAAGEYAQGLGRTLGFKHILTTPLCMDSDSLENCRERKRDRTMSLMAELGWRDRMRIFFTDHEEDLPLIRECEIVMWFGRDEDVPDIRAAAPGCRVIACRRLPDAEIMRLTGSG